jgi:predicted naringenin-chalcone synthase
MPEIVAFLSTHAENQTAARKAKVVAQKSGIDARYSVLKDFHPDAEPELFQGPIPLVEKRMEVYQREALPLAIKAINGLQYDPSTITHIITVSCTGMTAPGLELQLAQALKLPPSSTKLAVNFVGCHGAFHALKMAHALLSQNENNRILVVSVELCSLHYQPSSNDDTILANVLFGDGAAACLLGTEQTSNAIELNSFDQTLLPDEDGLMAWNIHSNGFLLRLSSYVPKAIEEGMGHVKLLTQGIPTHWAVHPGGKNIIEAVAQQLELDDIDLDASYQVLREVGNLSSATILFVLKRLLDSDKTGPLMALGFGPGLSIEMMSATLHKQ